MRIYPIYTSPEFNVLPNQDLCSLCKRSVPPKTQEHHSIMYPVQIATIQGTRFTLIRQGVWIRVCFKCFVVEKPYHER